jgi:ferredoxin, 2Fe-2S
MSDKIHKITFLPENIILQIKDGDSILDAALDNDIDLQHNCGGACACSTCHVIVKSGFENLSEMEDNEADQLDEAEGLTLTSRLGCQAKVHGDIIVEIPLINKSLRALFHEGKVKEE